MNFNNIIEYEFKRNVLKKFLNREYNITFNEYIVLMEIWELKEESITLKELKDSCKLVDSSISPVISKLVSLKYFNKERLEEDERMVRIYNIDYLKIEILIERIDVVKTHCI